jgi:cellulose synthase/poly-beta-1,6-N-acetylglucosamine synthase-like glycosyltransferase
LRALASQDRLPDEVVVSLDSDDDEAVHVTHRFERELPLVTTSIHGSRQLLRMEAGFRATTGDVVAMTDDDAEPHPDWMERLMAHYMVPSVGGVGGKDVPPGGSETSPHPADVGRVKWFGRRTGGHHLGSGDPREVEVIKGANFSLRRELWLFDHRLRGRGVQMHWELDLCLRARQGGWRILYDPGLLVTHHGAPRVHELQREAWDKASISDEAHNELYAILKWSPWWRKLTATGYSLVVGKRSAPGLVTAAERLLRSPRRQDVLRRTVAATAGRGGALGSYARFKRC